MDIPRNGWRLDAERRRARRRKLDLTLSIVANRIGISIARLHRWEKCRYRPSPDLAKAWDDALFKEAE